jgi:endogenous inhibitor of DNA gyrase (YacG/DUF329 family)
MSPPPEPSRKSSRGKPCPVCGKAVFAKHAPFCSAVCRDRDLIAWLDGRYAIPGPSEEPDEA